jgi:Arc/MetJ-type ribon-helix-helix transcriptional regulator
MIGLPEELYLKAETVVKTGKYGYSSISEFVKDAVRRRLSGNGREGLLGFCGSLGQQKKA